MNDVERALNSLLAAVSTANGIAQMARAEVAAATSASAEVGPRS